MYSNSDSDSVYEVHNLWAGLEVCTHEHARRKLYYKPYEDRKFDPERDCPTLSYLIDMDYKLGTEANT